MNENKIYETLIKQLQSLSVADKDAKSASSSGSFENSNVDTVTLKMSQANQINWNLFKSQLDNIKNYDGDSNTLNKFIFKCENLINCYTPINDDILNKHIFECIQGKLIGKAEVMVGNRTELNTWALLKDALNQCFADRRDLTCLVQELTRIRPQPNEHILNFGNRIQILRSSVVQRVSNNASLKTDEKLFQINHYNKTALSTFIAGCTGVLKNNMYLKNPATLEDAMAYVNEFENFERLYGHCKLDANNPFNKNNTTKFKPMTPPQNISQMPNFRQQNQNKFNFPSQPINIQSRPVQMRFPTNRQVFGPPTNVFKPKFTNTTQNQYKPEPMSTTSRNSTIRSHRPPMQNQFAQRPVNKNYFQIDPNQNYYYYENPENYQYNDNQYAQYENQTCYYQYAENNCGDQEYYSEISEHQNTDQTEGSPENFCLTPPTKLPR